MIFPKIFQDTATSNADEMKRLECLDIVFEIIFLLHVNFVRKNGTREKDSTGMLSLSYKFYATLHNMLKTYIRT